MSGNLQTGREGKGDDFGCFLKRRKAFWVNVSRACRAPPPPRSERRLTASPPGLTSVLVPRPEVVCGRDHYQSHEGREEIEKCVPAVIVLELLAGHFVATRGSPLVSSVESGVPDWRQASTQRRRSAGWLAGWLRLAVYVVYACAMKRFFFCGSSSCRGKPPRSRLTPRGQYLEIR